MARRKSNNFLFNGIDTVKETTKNVNNFALEAADSIVDETLATGAKWQKLLAKAVKSGVELFGKQQELVFDTLDNLKGQYKDGAKKVAKLTSTETETVKKAAAKVSKTKTTRAATRKTRKATATAKKAVSATRKTTKRRTVKK